MRAILFGFLGGIIAMLLFLSSPWSGSLVFNLLKSDLIGYIGYEPTPMPTPTTTSPDFWQKIVSDSALSTVAIQSFKSGKVIREGSGIVVSADGIVITTLDVVSGADFLQIFREDKILRAQAVKYDGFKNLALIKINASNMDVARLNRNYQFQPGQDIMISGKLVELSNPAVFAQRGIISRVLLKDIFVDVEPSYFLSGSEAINNSGVVVGMAYLRNGTVRLITAEAMDNFVKNYFESISR